MQTRAVGVATFFFIIQLPVVPGPPQATRAGDPLTLRRGVGHLWKRIVSCDCSSLGQGEKEHYGRSNFCLLFTIHPFSFKPKFSAYLCWWGQGKESRFACKDEWERLTLPQTRLGKCWGHPACSPRLYRNPQELRKWALFWVLVGRFYARMFSLSGLHFWKPQFCLRACCTFND